VLICSATQGGKKVDPVLACTFEIGTVSMHGNISYNRFSNPVYMIGLL
jgi:hypothetical protein